ncbi:MAG: hypothetical protein V7542_12950 [Limnobacter sp.]|uniref:hypothetical protein n=1 Tax=Limnobacter sp. TaxID=2003368 RepID=UPI003001D08D
MKHLKSTSQNISMRRRAVLSASVAIGVGASVPSFLAGCVQDGGESRFSSSNRSGISPSGSDRLMTVDAIDQEVRKMCAFGPRLTGFKEHNDYIDYLEQEFLSCGMTVKRDPQVMTRWIAKDWSLTVGGQSIVVDAYYPRSGTTSAEGVLAPLVYLPGLTLENATPDLRNLQSNLAALESLVSKVPDSISALASALGGVEGKIVLTDAFVPPLSIAAFAPQLTYANGSVDLIEDFKRAWIGGFLMQLDIYKQLGAAAVVFSFDATQANTVGQYVPFGTDINDIPALIVNRDTGAMLRTAAQGAPETRLVLTADITENVQTDSLVAVLPGMSDENMIVHSHSDGQNFAEENGCAAAVLIARHYASIPREQRPRSIVISMMTGHMTSGLPQTQGFIDDNPEIIANAVAAFTIEHLGCQQWLDDANGYRYTGQPEPAAVYHSLGGILAPALESFQFTGLQRAFLLRPVPLFFGVGGALNDAGVPSIAYIAGPNYLVQIDENSCLDKFDPLRMLAEMNFFLDLMHRVEVIPAPTLKAGMELSPSL